MLKRIWIFALLLGPVSCSATPPDWTVQPVNDSASHFYSIGSGANLDLARKNALDVLSSRLIVNVTNTTTTQVNNKDNQVSQSYGSSSQYKTEELAFFKVDIVKSHQEQSLFYAMISANKAQVFQAVQDKLNTELTPLLVQPKDEIGKVIANGLKLDAKLPRYQKYISLLKSYRQDTSMLDQQLADFSGHYLAAKKQTSFQVIQDGEFSQLKTGLTNKLGLAGFSQESSNNQLDVIIVGPQRQEAQQGELFAVKLSGDILYSFNNELIYTLPIALFEYGNNKRQVQSRISNALTSLIGE